MSKGKNRMRLEKKQSYFNIACSLQSQVENLWENFPSLSEWEREGNLGLNPQVITNRQGSRWDRLESPQKKNRIRCHGISSAWGLSPEMCNNRNVLTSLCSSLHLNLWSISPPATWLLFYPSLLEALLKPATWSWKKFDPTSGKRQSQGILLGPVPGHH